MSTQIQVLNEEENIAKVNSFNKFTLFMISFLFGALCALIVNILFFTIFHVNNKDNTIKESNEQLIGKDGQIQCPNCGESFTIDNIEIHLK